MDEERETRRQRMAEIAGLRRQNAKLRDSLQQCREECARSRAAEQERLLEQLRQANQGLAGPTDILESITDAFFAVDPDWRFTYVNREGERLLQRRREELIGRVLWEEFPAAVGSTFWRQYHRAVSEGVTVAFEEFYPPLGRWFDVRAYPSPSGLLVYFRDITERKHADEEREKLLQEVQKRAAELEAVIRSIADGVVIYNRDGQILLMNAAAQRLLGASQEEFGSRSYAERMKRLRLGTPEGKPFPVEDLPIWRALHGETVQGFAMVIHAPDGRTLWASVSAAPIRTPEGELLGAVTSFTDITEIHRLEEQREDLVRMVSHDLRSPLTAVQGQAQLLQKLLERSGQDGQLRQSAAAIYTNARRMNTMIQDLVDLARVESGQLALNRTPIALRSFLLELKQRMVGVLDTDRIWVEVPEGLPQVGADPDRLERVLTNLLSNALKYSEAEVRVTAAREEGQVRISVSDRGVGIPEEDSAHIFDRFYRVKGTRKAEGLGLGLYITRMLLDAMGGQIWAESELGRGSTFSFTLPLARNPSP